LSDQSGKSHNICLAACSLAHECVGDSRVYTLQHLSLAVLWVSVLACVVSLYGKVRENSLRKERLWFVWMLCGHSTESKSNLWY